MKYNCLRKGNSVRSKDAVPTPTCVPKVPSHSTAGLTLAETLIALFLTGLFMSLSIPYGLHFIAYQHLLHTREGILYDLRYSQQAAQTLGSYSMLKLSTFSPDYSVYNGNTLVGFHPFDPGVNYKDGYLQLTTGTILFDQVGNAQVGGVIRLVNRDEEADVNLYLGSGLVVAKDNLR